MKKTTLLKAPTSPRQQQQPLFAEEDVSASSSSPKENVVTALPPFLTRGFSSYQEADEFIIDWAASQEPGFKVKRGSLDKDKTKKAVGRQLYCSKQSTHGLGGGGGGGPASISSDSPPIPGQSTSMPFLKCPWKVNLRLYNVQDAVTGQKVEVWRTTSNSVLRHSHPLLEKDPTSASGKGSSSKSNNLKSCPSQETSGATSSSASREEGLSSVTALPNVIYPFGFLQPNGNLNDVHTMNAASASLEYDKTADSFDEAASAAFNVHMWNEQHPYYLQQLLYSGGYGYGNGSGGAGLQNYLLPHNQDLNEGVGSEGHRINNFLPSSAFDDLNYSTHSSLAFQNPSDSNPSSSVSNSTPYLLPDNSIVGTPLRQHSPFQHSHLLADSLPTILPLGMQTLPPDDFELQNTMTHYNDLFQPEASTRPISPSLQDPLPTANQSTDPSSAGLAPKKRRKMKTQLLPNPGPA